MCIGKQENGQNSVCKWNFIPQLSYNPGQDGWVYNRPTIKSVLNQEMESPLKKFYLKGAGKGTRTGSFIIHKLSV